MGLTYVFGSRFLASPYPASILHQYLGRQLGDRVTVVHDELLAALDDYIPSRGGNGKKLFHVYLDLR